MPERPKSPEEEDDTLLFDHSARPQPPQEQLHQPYLLQITGEETGRLFKLKRGQTTLGRSDQCDMMLDDPHVSRVHATIRCMGEDDVTIEDLGSANGIFVNGQRTQSRRLQDGDRVQIGRQVQFKFCYQDSADEQFQRSLFRAATVDELTQLYNRRYFNQMLAREFSFSRRSKQPLSLLLLDVDHFKQVNDEFGHPAGDQVLQAVAQILARHLRMENIACRFGGEEFAVILRNTDADQAFSVAERLRLQIEAAVVNFQNQLIRVTASFGIATLAADNFPTIERLIAAADGNLFEAKTRGRNCTVHAGTAPETEPSGQAPAAPNPPSPPASSIQDKNTG